MEPMDKEKEESGDWMMANVQFLVSAIAGVAFPAMWLFRYRANTYFDNIGETATSTNYW